MFEHESYSQCERSLTELFLSAEPDLSADRLTPLSKALATMIMEDLSPASAACSRYLKPFIRFPALSCQQTNQTRQSSNPWQEAKIQIPSGLPPPPCPEVCDAAAAGSTVLKLRWPPARHTARLSPGGTWRTSHPTARLSRRSVLLHGTGPMPDGPESKREKGHKISWTILSNH